MNIGANITKRSDGRYEARYEKGRNADGSIIYGFCYGHTREEAELKRNDAILLLENATSSDCTFKELLSSFSRHGVENLCLEDGLKNKSVAKLHERILCEITSKDIRELLAEYKKAHNAEETMSLYKAIKQVFAFAVDEGLMVMSPVAQSDMLQSLSKGVSKRYRKVVDNPCSCLLPEQEEHFVDCLHQKKNERRLGLLISLKMGLSFAEIAALLLSDIDFEKRIMTVNKKLGTRNVIIECPERHLPIPNKVMDYLGDIEKLYDGQDDFLVKKGKKCGMRGLLSNELSVINKNGVLALGYSNEMLRDTFAVGMLQSGVDSADLAAYMGESIEGIATRYKQYIHGSVNAVIDNERDVIVDNGGKLNLLILGAGDYGHTVKEIAEQIGVFDSIAFLDDNRANREAMDLCANYANYKGKYNAAFPAFGDNDLRSEYIKKLQKAGFVIPKLISPSATVSPSAVLDNGIVIEANATVNAGATVKIGSLICSSALVDKGATVSEYCHIDSNATVVKDSVVDPHTHIECGTVYRG